MEIQNHKIFSDSLLAWYDQYGRKDLPWQHDRTPYRVWLSEIMLQQTQVTTVIPYFEQFITRFPDIRSLASASNDEVMKLWAGLGYYARARNLHRCAQLICDKYDGRFPDDIESLQQLPGIGRSTAGAIVAQAFGKHGVILDGNVKRVLSRYRAVSGWPGHAKVSNQLWAIATELTSKTRIADYTQAVMDLGTMVCMRRSPNCTECPVSHACEAYADGKTDVFPYSKPKKSKPIRQIKVALCHQAHQSILLVRRPPAGIWGGLWSLPQCDHQADVEAFISATLGYGTGEMLNCQEISHDFTHFRLQIQPAYVEITQAADRVADSDLRWFSEHDIYDIGMPRPIEKLVKQFFSEMA
ncbi:MAG: A/G-specific adenine glycosylase [Gammaproteobacteria bacterium]|nr:MAG: A/G-specific adenine glycosylase [Gammaproteobacteria bacterium]